MSSSNSHPPSYNMHLGHGILSATLRSNTFDLADIEPSNRITETDFSWLLAGHSEERNSSTERISMDCLSISDASATSGVKFDTLKKKF